MKKEMESEALILSFRQKLEVQRFAANTVKNYVDYARVFLKYMQRSSDKVILIRQSKGNKDRMVTLSERLLNLLRKYYLEYRPKEYLFEGRLNEFEINTAV